LSSIQTNNLLYRQLGNFSADIRSIFGSEIVGTHAIIMAESGIVSDNPNSDIFFFDLNATNSLTRVTQTNGNPEEYLF